MAKEQRAEKQRAEKQMAKKLDDSQNRGEFFKSLGTLFAGFIAERIEEAVVGLALTYLRPPGALDELAFLTACTRCDKCMEACPQDSILKANASAGLAMGTPYIVPRAMPCFLCTDLPCVKVCPDDALIWPKAKRNDGSELTGPPAVRMGTAMVKENRCLTWPRGEYPAQSCRTCVDRCPYTGEALFLSSEEDGGIAHPRVNPGFCTGCGLCEFACPTHKPSIVVEPRR